MLHDRWISSFQKYNLDHQNAYCSNFLNRNKPLELRSRKYLYNMQPFQSSFRSMIISINQWLAGILKNVFLFKKDIVTLTSNYCNLWLLLSLYLMVFAMTSIPYFLLIKIIKVKHNQHYRNIRTYGSTCHKCN